MLLSCVRFPRTDRPPVRVWFGLRGLIRWWHVSIEGAGRSVDRFIQGARVPCLLLRQSVVGCPPERPECSLGNVCCLGFRSLTLTRGIETRHLGADDGASDTPKRSPGVRVYHEGIGPIDRLME